MTPTPQRRGQRAWPVPMATLALVASLSGCALQPPQAWERGLHARPEMSLSSQSLLLRAELQKYNSKEGASGGEGVGGGGCGCN